MTADDICIVWHAYTTTVTGNDGFKDVMGGALALAFGSGTSVQRGKARGLIRRGLDASETRVIETRVTLVHTPPDHPLHEARFAVVVKRAIARGDLL